MTALSDDTLRLAGILLLTVTTIEIGGQTTKVDVDQSQTNKITYSDEDPTKTK